MNGKKKIKCLVIDDEPPAQAVLKKYIAEVPALAMVGTCNNAIEAISFLQANSIDLLFLDIQMPGMMGTNFIRTLNNPPQVIFTTAYRKFAVEGFELNAVDYLLKPISFDRFITGINKVFKMNIRTASENLPAADPESENDRPFLYLRSNRKMVKIFFNEIIFIESLKDYLKIITTQKTIITRQSISSMEEMLPKNSFLRIHRSYIVALDKIDSFNGESIDIAKHELPIGRLFKHDVTSQLSK